ncbi:hypothetical protein HGRIS_003102 [Hohenbuehelia grisea]|uniref:F-box domain-containing protein n=1 Tax=Hohenbuehelia grisea TaxID=104357 RepID=A0ABR3JMQ2_9AGAR
MHPQQPEFLHFAETHVEPHRRPLFPVLETTNVPPDESQARDILTDVQTATKDIAVLDEEIHQATLYLERLRISRDGLKQHVQRCRRVLSPIRRLPPELLSEIFIYCNINEHRVNTDLLDVRKCPWTLGRVCGFWRAVANSTSQLWCEIRVVLGYLPKIPAHDLIELMETIVHRSGEHPLKVTMESCGEGALFHPVMGVLAAESRRWQVLDTQSDILPNLAAIAGRVPMLREINFHEMRVTVWRGEQEQLYEDIFSAVPLLRKVDAQYLDLFTARLPFSQLTHLSGQFQSAFDAYEVLKEATNLVKLSLNFEGDSGVEARQIPHLSSPLITLPHLRELELVVGDSVTFLDHFILPALTTLKYWNFSQDAWAVQVLPALFRRSTCPLAWLHINDLVLDDDDDLIQLLDSIPSVEHLHLGKLSAYGDTFFHAATVPLDNSPYLLPNLKILRIAPLREFQTGAMLDFIESRFAPPCYAAPAAGGRPQLVSAHFSLSDALLGFEPTCLELDRIGWIWGAKCEYGGGGPGSNPYTLPWIVRIFSHSLMCTS